VLYIRGDDCLSYKGCDNQLQVNYAPAILEGTSVPAGTYYIVVDGQNAAGMFHLTVKTF
jgi:hypothetical protein